MQPELTDAKRKWAHDELAADLAGFLTSPERMTWQNMQLGPSGSARPDVYAIWKSYRQPNPTVYECKVSLSDFRGDVTSGKFRSYYEFAWSVVFAVPTGLISKADVPDQCGLIVRHESTWRYAKRATVSPRGINEECLLKLLIDGVAREGPRYRAQHWNSCEGERKFAEKFGLEAARYVADAAQIHKRIEQAEWQANRILEDARESAERIRKTAQEQVAPLWEPLLQVFDLPPGTSHYTIQRRVNELKAARNTTREFQALNNCVKSLQRMVEQFEPLVREFEPKGDGEIG